MAPMPPGPITAWRIHLGAHKTATTHVQETLALMRPALVARGVDFIPIRLPAPRGIAVALGRSGCGTGCRRCAGRWCGGCWRGTSTRCAPGPPTLVLSEEKLIGGSQHVFSEPIYPRCSASWRCSPPSARRAEVTLFLVDPQLRHPAPLGLRPGAEVHAADRRRLRRPSGARVLARPPSWFELVRRIRAAAPGMPLRVWRQEDYRGHAAAILAGLCGLDDVGPLPEVADPAWTRSPDLAAIRAAEALPAAMPEPERRARVRAIFARRRPGDGRAASSRSPPRSGACCRRPTPPTSSGSPASGPTS